MLYEAYRLVQESKEISLFDEETEDNDVVLGVKNEDKEIFTIERDIHGFYHILGDRVIQTYKRINVTTDQGVMKLLAYLNKIGVDDALHKMNVKDGATIILDDFEFEYYN